MSLKDPPWISLAAFHERRLCMKLDWVERTDLDQEQPYVPPGGR